MKKYLYNSQVNEYIYKTNLKFSKFSQYLEPNKYNIYDLGYDVYICNLQEK